MNPFASVLSAAVLAVLAAGPASARSDGIRFQNSSGAVVHRIHSSPIHNSDGEQDLLGRDVLRPGQYLDVTIHDVANCA